MAKRLYLTTTLPYVNADPHIGFALEIVHADAYARYRRLSGDEVFFNTGTDEHGVKIYRQALAAKKDPQAFTDEYAAKFDRLKEGLNLSYDNFIRTTDPKHKAAAQEFWKRCEAAGDIYKKAYKIKYCVGCELEKTDSELVDGRCPIHPNLELEIIDEENYFFRFSKYAPFLLKLYEERSDFVLPDFRFNEIQKFVERGLEDFSISRLKEKMPWGVPVPGDDLQVMYVWFDALVNYISAIGWPSDEETFNSWWPVTQFAGKDQIRQQAAMWQAMLKSAGLSPSKQIIIHGFITSGGAKMSKSLGNVINPFAVVEAYGTDALRYYLLRHVHPFEDSDFTMEKMKEVYNGELANGLGNLAARIMQLAQTHLPEPIARPEPKGFPGSYTNAIGSFEMNRALDFVWGEIQKLDQKITATEPFKLVKTDPEKGKTLIAELATELYDIVRLLTPFMPDTSAILKEAILANKKPENLFPRKE